MKFDTMTRMATTLDSLRCFCAAAKTLNFRMAARLVALTPTAFGQRIQKLEEAFDEPLFVRSTRHVRLTQAGLALLPAAEAALTSVDACVRAVKSPHAFMPTSLLVGTRHELGLSWVVPQIDALAAEHPWLTLNLYVGSGADLITRVRSREIDCAILSAPVNDPQLDALRLHEEEYALVAAPRLLKRQPLRTAEEASSHTLIDADDNVPLFRYFRDAKQAPALKFARLLRFGTIDAIRARTLAGAGIAVLPEYLVRADLKAKRLARLFPKVQLGSDYFRLVFRKDDSRRAALESLARSMSRVPLR